MAEQTVWRNVVQTREERDKNIDRLIESLQEQLLTGVFTMPGITAENAAGMIEMLQGIKREDVAGKISVYPDGTLALAEDQTSKFN